MNEKQDRVYSRTPQDLEYKYGFGKSYAEMMGLIEDEQKSISELSGIVAEIIKNVDSIELKVSNDSGQLASLTTALNGITARVENAESGVAHALSITDSGIFITNDDDETFIDGGRIVANSITTNELSANVINGIEVGKMLAQGKYAGTAGDFISGREIRFPKIITDDLVLTPMETDARASITLEGYFLQGSKYELMDYFKLYSLDGGQPLTVFEGQHSSNATWDFGYTYVYGTIDFSSAKIEGLTAVFE